HDFIELSLKTPARIFEKCAPLYEKGLSIRDIEERTGIPKSTVRETLKKSGMVLRNPLNGNAINIDRLHTKRGGHTPYGYAYLDGQLIIDPKEQIIVRKIMKLHQSGLSGNAITKELSHQKIPSRTGKSWSPCVVRRIIKLNQSYQPKNRRTK
ncbi:MAG: recombinase family protein, partial [Bdellovibrio sp.]|nr:recombinase family protein [Bdellovibrio sp.]